MFTLLPVSKKSHISVVVCSFFEFGMVSKWCIRDMSSSRLILTKKVKKNDLSGKSGEFHYNPIIEDNITTLQLMTFATKMLSQRLIFNPFPNKPWFLCVCSASLWKTQGEKEKLLVTSYFSFSQSVFYPSGEFSAIFIKQSCRL